VTPLRSPASGSIVEKAVTQGARVMPGASLYRIADLSRVWVEGEVFEKDIARLSVGRGARIALEAFPGRTFEGRIAYVYPTVDPATRTGRVRVELANPGLTLKPGMYATLEFDVPVHAAGIHVPRGAVLQTGERSVVFVRAADGSLVPRNVRVGTATSAHVEILEGLSEGEVVVASANFLIDAESSLGASMQNMPGMNMPPESSAHGRH
jgi:membrane fusion protein, copper/silver efflux system